jgi:hypothetical protein
VTTPVPRRDWTVTTHGGLVQHEENLWSVDGMVPGAPFHRRMVIVRRNDGKLLFFHAVPLEDDLLARVRQLGQPAYLVVGHHQHAIDAQAFAERLGLKIYGPRRCEPGLRARCELAGFLEDVPFDSAVMVESLAGSKLAEAVLTVTGPGDARTVCFCDAIQNNPAQQLNLALRILGFAGGPKTPLVFRVLFLENKQAMRAAFEKFAALPGLKRLIPCHGEVVETGVPEALRTAAAAL